MAYWKRTMVLMLIPVLLLLAGCKNGFGEAEGVSYGIDVAKYQGIVDWEQVANSGVEFAMVRIGYRANGDGQIVEDPYGKYNLQEAQKYGVRLGVYFFSTAVSEDEAVEEAKWVTDQIAPYAITYPVAYDCEGYSDPESRQFMLGKAERTDAALAFLKTIEKAGYQGMFYASKNEMLEDSQWEVSRIQDDYKIWVAQYPGDVDPAVDVSSYTGVHQMWQYATDGMIPGIDHDVDMNIAYFRYEKTAKPKSKEQPPEVTPDPEVLMNFQQVNETVTAKDETNLRSSPSQEGGANIIYTLKNGELATRIAVSEYGWSKLVYNGVTCYAVSNYLTTNTLPDLNPDDDNIQTVFTEVKEQVTAKELANLRNIPSVEDENSKVIAKLKNGDVVTRTGINADVGWSRVEYNGMTLYCVSSLLTTVS